MKRTSELLAKLREAEELWEKLDSLKESPDYQVALLRYAFLRDEITGLMMLAEETLSAAQVRLLQSRVNRGDPLRWLYYRRNQRFMKRLTGKELWERL